MTKSDEALALFGDGFNCAQAVLAAFAKDFGLDKTTALRLGGGFGGGMGRQGLICGAVTGAMMVIGLKFGKVTPEDNAARDRAYNAVTDFSNRFKAQYGSLFCRDLIGCDISTPEGRKYIHSRNIVDKTCPPIVQSVVTMTEQIINS